MIDFLIENGEIVISAAAFLILTALRVFDGRRNQRIEKKTTQSDKELTDLRAAHHALKKDYDELKTSSEDQLRGQEGALMELRGEVQRLHGVEIQLSTLQTAHDTLNEAYTLYKEQTAEKLDEANAKITKQGERIQHLETILEQRTHELTAKQ